MHPIVSLLEHDRLRSVDHLGGHFEAAVGRQAVHEDRSRGGERHHVGVDGVALELLPALFLLRFLTHRHPRVGVDRVGAPDGVGRTMGLLDVALADQPQPFQLGVVRGEPRRGRQPHPGAEQQS